MISKMFCTEIRTATNISFKHLKVPLRKYNNEQEKSKNLILAKRHFYKASQLVCKYFKILFIYNR